MNRSLRIGLVGTVGVLMIVGGAYAMDTSFNLNIVFQGIYAAVLGLGFFKWIQTAKTC